MMKMKSKLQKRNPQSRNQIGWGHDWTDADLYDEREYRHAWNEQINKEKLISINRFLEKCNKYDKTSKILVITGYAIIALAFVISFAMSF